MALQRLVERAQAGDNHAANQVITDCEQLVSYIMHRYGYYLPAGGDHDDLHQEALLGLFKGIRDYDSTKGTFRTFARVTIQRQVITAIKASVRRKHEILNSALSFSVPLVGVNGYPEDMTLGETLGDPKTGVERSFFNHELLQQLPDLLTTCTEIERICVGMFAQDFSYKEIAEFLDTGTKSVDNALQRARRKLADLEPQAQDDSF